MTGFNHALVGGLIGRLLPWPVAVPVAIASHFILDMLPHYGIPAGRRDVSDFWKLFFIVDFFATLSLAFWAIANHHYAMYVCGQLAVLPDFVWVAHVLRTRSFNFSTVRTRYEKWHIAIQKYEFSKGLWVELPLSALLFYIVVIQAK
jgi:hypothetical protein